MRDLARDIAEYVNTISYKELSENTVHDAKRCIIDIMGCAIGASNELPVRIARKSLDNIRSVSESASVIGTSIKTSPDLAAFINALSGRYFDYNDSYEAKEFAHPSDNIMPIIAVAEAEKKSGADILLAVVLAYEIQCRLCDSASIWRRGWDHVVYGLVSVSAVSSMLMDLDQEKTEQAINIALSSHISMRQVRAGELSMWKAASFANSARNAIFSAMLAKNGMTGPSPIFEGEMGLWKQVSGRFDINVRRFGNSKRRFKITENIMKYFPAEIRSQSAISAALNARRKINSIEEIKKIDIMTTESGYKILGKDPEKWEPKTKETADHSLPYVVAVALVDGKLDIDSYKPAKLKNSKILGLMKITKVKEEKKFTAIYPSCIPNRVKVTLKNGNVIEDTVLYQKGHRKNPMSDSEVEAKFGALTRNFIMDKKRNVLIERLWNLEQIKNAKDIIPNYEVV